MTTIATIGAGAMGSAIAARLYQRLAAGADAEEIATLKAFSVRAGERGR